MPPALEYLFLAAFMLGCGYKLGSWWGRTLYPVTLAVLLGTLKVIQQLLKTLKTITIVLLAALISTEKATETNTIFVSRTKNTSNTEKTSQQAN